MTDLAPILKLLHSADENDRRQGILELIRCGDQMTVPILTKLAAEDTSVEVRYYARRALGSIRGRIGTVEQGSTPGIPDISVRDLLGSDSPHIRFEGLKKALANPDPENARMVRRALERETVTALRASFVVGLGRLGGPDEVDLLTGYLRDPDSRVRANAVEALATIGSEEAYLPLVPLLQDEDNRVRANAIKALQAYGGAPLLSLLRRMASESEVWMRDSAMYALVHFKSPHAIAVIARMATEAEPLDRLREKALDILKGFAEAGNTLAREWLEKISPSFKPVLGPIVPPAQEPQPPPDPSALANLDAPEMEARLQALTWLTENATAEDLPPLLGRLQLEIEPLLVSMILSLLRRLRFKDAFSAILPFLESRDDRVRANAVEALATIDPPKALSYLHPLLKDDNNRVRANVIHALCADDLFDPVEPLRTLVEDSRDVFRRSALYVISLIRRPRFVEFLDRLLDDTEPPVRDMSFAILEEYQAAGIRGARDVFERISARIKLDRERERYFQNQFDEVFSVVVTAVSVGDEKTGASPVAKSPSNTELEALLRLGKKAEQCGMVSPEFTAEFDRLDRERSDAERRVTTLAADPGPESAGNVSGETIPPQRALHLKIAATAELERLRTEVRKLGEHRDILLVRVGRRLVRERSGLQPEQRTALEPELKEALVQASVHVPAANVSLLPSLEASPTEIFDLTLRIYQKHVIAFSLVPGGVVAACFAYLFVAAFMTGIFMALSKPLGALFAVGASLVGTMVLALGYGGFTWIVTRMMKQFLEGRNPDYWMLIKETGSEVWPIAWLQVRKTIRLAGWGIAASVIAFICVGPLRPFLEGDVFGRAILKLVALGIFAVFFGRPFVSYLLVEPWFILEGRKTGGDPFLESTELVAPFWGRTFLLFALANLLSSLITGTTTEVLDLLPATQAIEFMKGTIGIVSFVCLYALAYANLVVFTMMLLAARRRLPRVGTAS